MLELEEENTNCARIIARNIAKPEKDCAIWCCVPLTWSKSGNGTESNSDDSGCERDGTNEAARSWHIWDEFRMSLGQNHRAYVALRIEENLPLEYGKDFERWVGEPIKAILIPKSLFRMNRKGYPVLLKTHQEFILKFAHLDPYLIIEVGYKTRALLPYILKY